jgi:hypothetical protein
MTNLDYDPRRPGRDPAWRLETQQPDPSLQTAQGGPWAWAAWIGLLAVLGVVLYGLNSGQQTAGVRSPPAITGGPPATASNPPETTGQGTGQSAPGGR